MNNVKDVRRLPVAKLLDEEFRQGRYFYIPDYQRGYRWTSQQVEELLQDLLIFAINNKSTDHYYCLQPIVVRDNVAKKCWEVIDGQQRLTTIRIILHYLEQVLGSVWREASGVSMYSIIYETRENSNDFINGLNHNCNRKCKDDSIDEHFIRDAYFTVVDWFKGGASKVFENFNMSGYTAFDFIWKLLVLKSVKCDPTAQVLWYEVSEDEDPIRLFNSLNTNKLDLTEAELVKGLFLLKANFCTDTKERTLNDADNEQFRMAMKWEEMENALYRDDFWSFLTLKGDDSPNRIDLLLKLVYAYFLKKKKGLKDEEIEEVLKDTKKRPVFNYYNDRLNVDHYTRERRIGDEWKKIRDAFLVMEDWYSDPVCYNLIGFLCHSGIAKLHNIYSDYLDCRVANKSRDDFIDKLRCQIQKYFEKISVTYKPKEGDGNLNYTVHLYYDELAKEDRDKEDLVDNSKIRNILLLLNIEHLIKRILDGAEQDTKIENDANKEQRRLDRRKLKPGELDLCKFPFAVLADSWDIEHVDSQTVNGLEKPDQQRDWLKTELLDIRSVFSKVERSDEEEDELEKIEAKFHELEMSKADDVGWPVLINRLRRLVEFGEEGEVSEKEKHNIANLVLLDSHTNRRYQNALFINKRKLIIESREKGQYFPEITSYVFFKLFDKSASSKWCWGKKDMQEYANFIVKQLEDYLPEAKPEKEEE